MQTIILIISILKLQTKWKEIIDFWPFITIFKQFGCGRTCATFKNINTKLFYYTIKPMTIAPKVKLLGTCPFQGRFICCSRHYVDYFKFILLYFIRNPTFLAAENRDFGRFVTTWYNVHCKHTLFFEYFRVLNEFFLEEAWFWGVRVGFGGREGVLASALICI